MFRLMFAAILMIFGCACFANENLDDDLKNVKLDNQTISMTLLCEANENLETKNFAKALEYFHMSHFYLIKSERKAPEVMLMIVLGKIVACDNLGFADQCAKNVGFLLSILGEEDLENENDLTSEVSSEDYKEVADFINNLSSLALTSEVKEILNDLGREIGKVGLKSCYSQEKDLSFNNYSFNAKTDGFFKAVKKVCKEVKKFIKKVIKVIKDAKKTTEDAKKAAENVKEIVDDVKEIIQSIDGENKQNNTDPNSPEAVAYQLFLQQQQLLNNQQYPFNYNPNLPPNLPQHPFQR